MKFTYASGSRPLDGYTIKRGVGCGGFGEVYFATSDGGKEVALKLIRRNLDVELRGVQQCLNLKHPNLVALYDIRKDAQDDTWVVMEYVGGESLEEVIGRHPKGLPEAEALRWFQGIASAVAYLHDHGIVHRDLKPGNIFCDEQQVKLGDYGLSKFISVSRRSGQTESVGTVHYMAPEIAKGRYGKEIDIYALGVMLYELLTGDVPFAGESIGEVLMKHLTAEPELARVPMAYRRAVGRSLAKDPAKRPKSVSELLALLPGSRPAPSTARTAASIQEVYEPGAKSAPAKPSDRRQAWGPVRSRRGAWKKNCSSGSPKDKRNRIVLLILGIFLMCNSSAWATHGALVGQLAFWGGLIMVCRVATSKRPFGRLQADRVPTSAPPVPTMTQPPAMPAAPPPVRQAVPARAAESPVQAMLVPSSREQLADLTGSMLLSAGVTAALSLIAVIFHGTLPKPEEFAWLMSVGTVGSWLVLVPAKLWESSHVDGATRRFVLMMMGLLLGLFAWGMDRALWLDLNYDWLISPTVTAAGTNAYEPDGQPRLLAYLAYFGFMFLLLRWSTQADPWRSSRTSLWQTIVCIGWATVLNVFWPFPQPWGMMTAGTISLAVQLSSSWHGRGRKFATFAGQRVSPGLPQRINT
jgi:hypothetical protein